MSTIRVRVACSFLQAAVAACTSTGLPEVQFEVQDSSGVRIVQSFEPTWGPGSGWRLALTPSLVIAAPSSRIEDGPLSPVSVHRNAVGELVVGDGGYAGWHLVLMFDATGRYSRSLGGQGGGPCEFRQLSFAEPYRGDSILALDVASLGKAVVLHPEGGCREPRINNSLSFSGPVGVSGGVIGSYPDGNFLVYRGRSLPQPTEPGILWSEQALLRLDADGAFLDSLGIFPGVQYHWNGARLRPLIAYGAQSFRVIDQSELLVAQGSHFEVRRHDSTGRLKEIVRLFMPPQLLTESDKAEFVSRRVSAAVGVGEPGAAPAAAGGANIQQRIASFVWPEYKPMISSVMVDSDRNIWIEEYHLPLDLFDVLEEDPPRRWSVFNPEGVWLGNVEVPSRLQVKRIYGNELLGVWFGEL